MRSYENRDNIIIPMNQQMLIGTDTTIKELAEKTSDQINVSTILTITKYVIITKSSLI